MNFYNWSMENGYSKGLSIDRIDNDKGYSPSNCRWIPVEDQVLNKRNVKLIKYKDKEMSAQQWSLFLGWNKNTIKNRLNKGLPLEEVMTYKGGGCY